MKYRPALISFRKRQCEKEIFINKACVWHYEALPDSRNKTTGFHNRKYRIIVLVA